MIWGCWFLKFTTAQKSSNILFTYWKLYSSDQSMKTLDSDLKVNRNIYPDAVNISVNLYCFLEESQWENKLCLSTQDCISSKQWLICPNWPLLGPSRCILSHLTASGYVFQLTFRSLSDFFIPWWV